MVPRLGRGPKHFVTTHWSVMLWRAGGGGEQHSVPDALAQICQIYWRPILAYICRRGHSLEDAQDLTQEFFLLLVEGKLIESADPARGRFRALLLSSLRHFLTDVRARGSRRKRGGQFSFISWEDWVAEAPSQFSVPLSTLEQWPDDRMFDLRWAASITEQALRRLREECESRGRGQTFDELSPHLLSDRADLSYAGLAGTLRIPEPVIKKLIHQLRARFRVLLREEVRQTVQTEADIDDELRYLCSVLAAAQQ